MNSHTHSFFDVRNHTIGILTLNMSSTKNDVNVHKRSFEHDTLSSIERNSNNRNTTIADSLDLHLTATYDHQYNLFVNKTDVVSQLRKIELQRKEEKQQSGTDSMSIVFGKSSTM